MQYEVVVPIPVRSVWDTFHDAERLARCVPGLLLDEPARTGAEGIELTGRWQLRVGADTITHRGTLRLVDAIEPLALVASVEGVESVDGAGDGGDESGDGGRGTAESGTIRVGAEFAVRLYDLDADDEDGPSRTRIVFADASDAADGGGAGDAVGADPIRPAPAFTRAADLFAAALTDELAPAPADTPFESVVPIPDPFATPRARTQGARPSASGPAAIGDAEPDLWSRAGHGTGRAARRAVGVLVPVLGALFVWRRVHVRRRRAG
ncbi:hypothetical protein OG948_19555 [Embleya sp. NBC_00888]|uniref:hypothetical protein n=1 Tax=Embleya sp. NBC_00888 TaxID=2975960 RepID=UPI00386937FF|nr:hypothetical protein OG948_19555 [Embleya sp. NBC_00888]